MFIGFNVNDQHHQGYKLADTNHALFSVVVALIFKQGHWHAEHLFSISEIKLVLFQIGLPLGFIPGEVHGLDYADKNTHSKNLNNHCIKASDRAKVRLSLNTGLVRRNIVSEYGAFTHALSWVFSRPNTLVYGRDGLVREAGRMAYSMFLTSRPPYARRNANGGLQSQYGAETMTTVNTTTTPVSGNKGPAPTLPRITTVESALRAILSEVTPGVRPYSGDSWLPAHLIQAAQAALDGTDTAAQQHAHNALSMAAWHCARGEPAQALARLRRAQSHIKASMEGGAA